jgi:hypothetical protein
LIAVRDRRRYVKAFIFKPDPVTTSKNLTLTSTTPEQTLNAQRQEVDLRNLDPPISGKHFLKGRWCFCKDIETPNLPPPNTATDFRFGAKDRNFLSVMAYYWVDQAVEYLRSFNIPAYNSAVEATKIALDAQGLDGADNSHFTTDANGAPYLAFGEGGVPDAADAHVILHEYGHAMHWYLGTTQNDQGNEEGFGDVLAGTFLDRFNAAQFGRESVFPWDNNAGNRYSMDRFFNSTRKFSDGGFDNLEIHIKGSVLAATLWDLFLALGGNSGEAPVRSKAGDTVIHLYMEMVLSAAHNAPVRDLAQGMIVADQAINAGVNVAAIRTAFMGRGLNLGGANV